MAEAVGLAARIPRRPWPNPPVGAIVVCDGRVVGRGAHHGAGAEHAEIVALREAGLSARGATLYCTLEPCNHQGLTPPCAPSVASSGIARAVVGVADSNPRVCGDGLGVLRRAGIDVALGVLAKECLELIWPFVASRAFERPFVLLKTATSLDARFAPARAAPRSGPVYLTGCDARREAHRLRRWSDVVVVGEKTMSADRPRLDGRLVGEDGACPVENPVPAYVDTDLSLEDGRPQRPHWVFAGRHRAPAGRRRAAEKREATVVVCDERDGHVAPESLVAEFQRRGGYCLMIEGGPTLAAAFLRRGLVDRWVSFTAPIVIGDGPTWPAGWGPAGSDGPGGAGPASAFHLTRVTCVGPDVAATFDRVRFADVLGQVTRHGVETR